MVVLLVIGSAAGLAVGLTNRSAIGSAIWLVSHVAPCTTGRLCFVRRCSYPCSEIRSLHSWLRGVSRSRIYRDPDWHPNRCWSNCREQLQHLSSRFRVHQKKWQLGQYFCYEVLKALCKGVLFALLVGCWLLLHPQSRLVSLVAVR